MEYEGYLFIVAEVSVVFAGFTGLAAALSGNGKDQWSLVDRSRLRNLILYSVLTVLLALFPFLPHAAGFDQSTVWRLSVTVFAIQLVIYHVVSAGYTKDLFEADNLDRGGWVLVVGDTLVLAACISSAFGWFYAGLPTVYIAALYWYLAGACITFYQVMAPSWRRGAPSNKSLETDA